MSFLTEKSESWAESGGLVSVNDISLGGLRLLFETAVKMRKLVKEKGGDRRLEGRVLATVFFEASTRTSSSFQAAICRLGGSFVHVDGGVGGTSSASKKGESLSDTIRCMECYSDITVLRHPIRGSIASVLPSCTKPLVNAGDGVGEHPTQALLDLFTIVDELSLPITPSINNNNNNNNIDDKKDPLVIVMLGDLKHGRTVHSLAKLIARVGPQICGREIHLRYCSPASLPMPEYVQTYVNQFAVVKQETFEDLTDAIQNASVLYVTRLQKERFDNTEDYERLKGAYVVDQQLLNNYANNEMIVMHPLPRVDEIHTNVDNDPRAAYFRQMENGMYVRMAILALLLNKP